MGTITCALLAAAAFGHGTGPRADTFNLRWTPKQGQVIKYSTEGSLDIQGKPSTFTSKSQETIVKVDTDGTYSVESKTTEGKVVLDGQEMPMAGDPLITIYKPNGEIVSISGDRVEAASYRSANLEMLKRPDNPVGIGEKWEDEVKADPKTGAVGVKCRFTLDSEEKIGDTDTLKVIAHSAETEGGQPGSADATFWLSKADGSVVKFSIKWSNMLFPGAPQPLSGSMTMTRAQGS